MPKENLKKSQKGLNVEKPKSDTVIVKGTVTVKQKEVIGSLVGAIGSNEQDVVGKILTIWLYNEGYLKQHDKS